MIKVKCHMMIKKIKYNIYLNVTFSETVVIDDYNTIRQIMSSDNWLNRPTDEWMMERSYGKQLGSQFKKYFSKVY